MKCHVYKITVTETDAELTVSGTIPIETEAGRTEQLPRAS